jgi:DNA-directed RNA polymerase subunit beta'
VIEDDDGTPLIYYPIPEKAYIEVDDKVKVKAGTLVAKTPRETEGTQDITGGLPRVTEIFEARRPKEPAIMAEIDGVVELVREMKRGKRTILVKNEESGIVQEHLVPHGKHLKVQTADRVRAGQPLTEGPLIPHDILRISGEDALQQYLLREVQGVYRSQNVTIDDKHIETIVSQMLRKVQVADPGDTDFLPDAVVDKFRFRRDEPGHGQAEEAPGDRRADPAGHHQGRPAERLDDLRRVLPGDHQGAARRPPSPAAATRSSASRKT